jgi:hypothetical protein
VTYFHIEQLARYDHLGIASYTNRVQKLNLVPVLFPAQLLKRGSATFRFTHLVLH